MSAAVVASVLTAAILLVAALFRRRRGRLPFVHPKTDHRGNMDLHRTKLLE